MKLTNTWLLVLILAASGALFSTAATSAEETGFASLGLPRPAEAADDDDSQGSLQETASTPTLTLTPERVEPELTPKVNDKVQGSLSLADAGIREGLHIDGHQIQTGFVFTLPRDRVVSSARLVLNLKVSDGLVDGQHYLNLMLNGQDLAQLPLSQAVDSINHFTLDIPAPMMVSVNSLSMTLEEGQTLQCEANSETRYSLQVMPDSHVEYQGILLDIAPDLSQFPRPFMDKFEMRRGRVDMVFGAEPDAGALSAASIISAWLGMKADFKGIDIPVSLGSLPVGNAIVFAHPGEQIGELRVPDMPGGALWMTDNPAGPQYKLLIVSGHSADELKNAAYALTHTSLPAGEATLKNIGAQKIPTRQPYDAPRWVDTRHPVTLRTLMGSSTRFDAYGINHDAIRVAFRAAPDLFLWDGDTIPVRLGYFFPGGSWVDEERSTLGVSLNGRFLEALPVNKTGAIEKLWHRLGGDTRQHQKTLRIQPWQIYGDNEFAFWFSVKPKANAPCEVFRDNSIKSVLDPHSTLDLTHTWHFSELPNLAYFIGASFPFSRQADLQQTAILLPAHPGATEISTLLSLMARSGNATGVTPHGAHLYLGEKVLLNNTALLKGKDVLVVAGLNRRAMLGPLFAASPFDLQENQLSVSSPNLSQQIMAWLSGDWARQGPAAQRYLSSVGEWRGFISFRSPWDRARSVIAVTATSDAQLASLPSDLSHPAVNAAIRGDLTLITHNDGVHSWRIGSHYVSGSMPWYLRILWYASQHILQLGLLCVLLAGMMGLMVFLYLKNQAEQRLKRFTGHRR